VRLIFDHQLDVGRISHAALSVFRALAVAVGLAGALASSILTPAERRTFKAIKSARAIGSIMGIVGASLIKPHADGYDLRAEFALIHSALRSLFMTYVGLVRCATNGDMLNLSAMGGISAASVHQEVYKDSRYECGDRRTKSQIYARRVSRWNSRDSATSYCGNYSKWPTQRTR